MKSQLSGSLEALTMVSALHEVGVRSVLDNRAGPVLEAWLDAALCVAGTTAGCVHVVDDVDETGLRLMAHRGFEAELVQLCESKRESVALLAPVLERRQRMTFDDSSTAQDCPTVARGAIYGAGALALQVTPVYASNGGPLAVLSIFLNTSRRPTDAQLQLIDLCCRQAAGFLELARSRKAEHGRRVQDNDHPGPFRRRDEQALATLAHEIRQPVAAALQAVELRKLSDRSEDQQQAAEIIERQLRHIARLVEDLSAPSHARDGALPVQRVRLDLREALLEALQTTSALFEDKDHERQVNLPARPVMVSADATRMNQMFINLLQNAASYTPPKGRIAVSLVEDGDWIRVRIRDNGIGIRPDALGTVFEAFARNSDDGDSSHLGVGLALVRQIAELHGGSAVAHSDGEGAGSEFVISLPAARGDGELAHATSRHEVLFEETVEQRGDIRHGRLTLRPKGPAGEPARAE